MKKEKPNKTTLKAIEEAEKEMKNPSSGKTYQSVEELMKDLKD